MLVNAEVDLNGSTNTLSTTGLNISASGLAVAISNGRINGLSPTGFGKSGSSLVLTDVELSFAGINNLDPADNSTLVFAGSSKINGRLRPWGCTDAKIIFREGETTVTLQFTGYAGSGTSITISNAVLRVGTAPNTTYTASSVHLYFYGDAHLEIETAWTFRQNCTMAIPEEGVSGACMTAASCQATPTGRTYTVDVTNYKSGRKVPIIRFTGADQSSVMEGYGITLVAQALTKNGTLVDVTAMREARLEWSATDNTLYYVQKSSDVSTIIIR
jgi:hypothetical protein